VPLGTLYAKGMLPANSADGTDTDDVPLVSVIIPCYSQSQFLGEAIESVLAQTYPHIEIIVVDDGSLDNTVEVVARYPGVRLVRQHNQGVSVARNTGIRHSSGMFLVFLDSDDRLLPDMIQSGIKYMDNNPQYALVGGLYEEIGFDGTPRPLTWIPPDVQQNHYCKFLECCYIMPPGAALVRRRAIEVAGGFAEHIYHTDDHEFFMRIARHFPVMCHREVVVQYRLHGANKSRREQMTHFGVRTIRQQWNYIRRNPEYRRAYHRGIRNYRNGFGKHLMRQVQQHFQQQQWRPLLRGLWTLLPSHPQGVVQILTQELRLYTMNGGGCHHHSSFNGTHRKEQRTNGTGNGRFPLVYIGTPGPERPRCTYVICATPRTGSTLLCELLRKSRIAGRPGEYFNQNTPYFWARWWEDPTNDDIWQHHIQSHTTRNGVFGVKLLWYQFDHLVARARQVARYQALTPPALMNHLFDTPHYIWITRRDRVRQAVSLSRAEQSGSWMSTTTPSQEAVFDAARIDKLVKYLTQQDQGWQNYFAACGVKPLAIVYEDFVVSREATVQRVLDYLNIPMSSEVQVGPPRLQRQADAQSEEWVQRYDEYKRHENAL
jgi:LPS sulfotransferase NodH/glycosyltransferase involved in cell wall biosynthesis